MADGKQWYNSPQEEPSGKKTNGKKINGKSGNLVKKQGKPGVNQSAKQGMKQGTKQFQGNRNPNKTGNAPVSKGAQKHGSLKGNPKGTMPNKEKSIIPPIEPVNKTSTGKISSSSGLVTGSSAKTNARPNSKSPVKQMNRQQGKPASKMSSKQPVKQSGKQQVKQSDRKDQSFKNKKKMKYQAGVKDQAVNKGQARVTSKADAKEIARQKEQQKILEQAKRKEEAKLKEQAKIEKNEFKRKNPSQKSAESRAIRNGILGAVAVAAALFVLVFVVHHLYDYIAEKPNFSFVTTGAVEHTIGARALIVRDEDTINCVNSGELVTQITEGSRVAKDQELAIVVPDEMKSVVQDLRNVQSQISDVQQELIMSGGVTEADVIYRNYNKNLSAILDSVRFDSMGGNLSNMSSYGSSVNVILDEREDEMSRIDFDDERISVLRTDEAVYEAQVEKYASRISAHRPGIVSFRLDGQENVLDYNMFLSLPVSDIKSYINNSVGAISSDLSVEADTPVVRIAQNESQYISVFLSASDAAASDFAVGTLHDINIRTEGVAIDNCKVVRCESDNSGMLITFETSRYVEALLDLRTVDIEIVITETDGMRVSVPSLVNEIYAPKGNPAFCVYLAQGANVGPDTFAEEAIFNVTIIPNAKTDEEGNPVEQQNTSVGGCKVIHTETLADGGTIVAFATPNDYSNLKKIDRLYTEGYTASFVDTGTGLGLTTDKIKVSDYSGIASVYTNNQGFVEEVRVLVLDNDREFAIIDQAGKSTVPNLNTVIITNPKTVKPGDKVD